MSMMCLTFFVILSILSPILFFTFRVPVLSFVEGFRVFRGLKILG